MLYNCVCFPSYSCANTNAQIREVYCCVVPKSSELVKILQIVSIVKSYNLELPFSGCEALFLRPSCSHVGLVQEPTLCTGLMGFFLNILDCRLFTNNVSHDSCLAPL